MIFFFFFFFLNNNKDYNKEEEKFHSNPKFNGGRERERVKTRQDKRKIPGTFLRKEKEGKSKTKREKWIPGKERDFPRKKIKTKIKTK